MINGVKVKGNNPDDNVYIAVGEISSFSVWVKMKSSNDFISVKLVAKKTVEHKANYWIAFNPDTGEMKGRDADIMKTHCKGMVDGLVGFLMDSLER